MIVTKQHMYNLMSDYMTDNGYELIHKIIETKLPDIWNKSTSSTGKHHKKKDGTVPTIVEHTYEMLYAAIQTYRMFNIEPKTSDMDLLLTGVVLHDALKYGEKGTMFHTHTGHDRLMSKRINKRREIMLKIFNEFQCEILEEMVHYHSGRWSTGLLKKGKANFKLSNYHPFTAYIHTLDMLSTADVLKY